jgi:peroxiredoxin Q/BCP
MVENKHLFQAHPLPATPTRDAGARAPYEGRFHPLRSRSQAMLKEGDSAPATVMFQDSEERPVSLSAWRGTPVVVYFYPKADTPGCTSEAQAFTALAADFAAANVPVVGVSRDKPAKLRKFAEKYGLKVALVSDEEGALCEAFGTWVQKSLYGREYMGIERATFLIDGEGTIVKVWPRVKVKGHAAAVLEAVKAL